MLRNKKNGVVYSCITGRYDELIDHTYHDSEWDYVCFSDVNLKSPANTKWQIKKLKFNKLDPHRNQRWHKFFPSKILKKYTYSVYVDANVDIIDKKFFILINDLIKKDSKVAQPYHPERDCVYDEIDACIKLNKDNPSTLTAYKKFIKSTGMPTHYGLSANTIIFRKHNDKTVKSIMEIWWKEYLRSNSLRDQLSWPYVLWANKYKPAIIKMNIFDKSEGLMKRRPHNYKQRA